MHHRGSATLSILLTILACVTGGLFARFAIRDNVFPRNFGVVEPGHIYRAGRLTPAAMQQVVKANAIKTVIDLGAYEPNSQDARLAADTAKALGVTLHNFKLNGDGTGNPDYYVEALRILADPATHPVLVHCAAGSQRTSACIMFYRKIYQDVPFDQSISEAIEHDHDPADNTKLRPYIEKNLRAIEDALKQP